MELTKATLVASLEFSESGLESGQSVRLSLLKVRNFSDFFSNLFNPTVNLGEKQKIHLRDFVLAGATPYSS